MWEGKSYALWYEKRAGLYTESLLYGYYFKIFDLLRSYLLWFMCTQLAQRLGHSH